jgi:hypothetical protein
MKGIMCAASEIVYTVNGQRRWSCVRRTVLLHALLPQHRSATFNRIGASDCLADALVEASASQLVRARLVSQSPEPEPYRSIHTSNKAAVYRIPCHSGFILVDIISACSAEVNYTCVLSM